jgi:GTPase SAR1 family protein
MDDRELRSWENGPKYSFKIIVLGSKGVGKSSLLKRFQFDEFEDVPSHTIGVGFSTHNIEIGFNSVQVRIAELHVSSWACLRFNTHTNTHVKRLRINELTAE